MKYFCLSFDLEEFDVPLESGEHISKEEMFRTSLEGTKRIVDLIERYNIKATFFVTTGFCKKYPNVIKKLSESNEIACHGEHDRDYRKLEESEALGSIKQNKALLEKTVGRKVLGFRAPRMHVPDYEVLKKLGLSYDASLHPTYVPGRYNNILMPRKIFRINGLAVVPTSVAPIIKAPFTWLWFRNFGLTYSKVCTTSCFIVDDCVNIYFHPWEFQSLSRYKIPFYIKKNTGLNLEKNLNDYLGWCVKKGFEFVSIKDYLKIKGILVDR